MTTLAPLEVPFLRTPPHNFEAEMALLGAIMFNNRALDAVSDFLKPEHFADSRHARIYEACLKVVSAGGSASIITLKNYLEQDNSLADIGGAQYLARLASAVVTVINAKDYGRIIFELWMRRQLIGELSDFTNRAFSFDLETEAIALIEECEMSIARIAESASSDQGPVAFGAALQDAVVSAETAWKAQGKVTGVSTGLIDLDKVLGGLHKTDLIILAGRPGMGKTALALTITRKGAAAELVKAQEQEGYRPQTILFFSLEMSAEQLAARELAAETGISTDRQRRGALKLEDVQELMDAQRRLGELPIEVDDGVKTSVAALRSRARRVKRQRGLALVVVDYLQLLIGGKEENRVQEIAKITRDLKMMAKELKVPVLALSQLSRQVEMREDKRPQLSDLRDSGSIEQDADVVMFVYRDEEYLVKRKPQRREGESGEKFMARMADWDEEMQKVAGIAELIIGKNRHGPQRTVRVFYDAERTRFRNLHNGQPE